jgi:hypothetical protein
VADTPSSEWQQRLSKLLYTQFAQTVWAKLVVSTVSRGRAALADLFIAFIALWSIDTITDDSTSAYYGVGRGVQLDRIGKLVGQPRGAATDSEYRPILRARILTNKSDGSSDVIINIFLAMFADAGTPLIIPGWVAQYTLRLVGVIMDPLVAPAAVGLLNSATQGGTRAVLEWTTTDPSHTLIYDATGATQGWGDLSNLNVGGWSGDAAGN